MGQTRATFSNLRYVGTNFLKYFYGNNTMRSDQNNYALQYELLKYQSSNIE